MKMETLLGHVSKRWDRKRVLGGKEQDERQGKNSTWIFRYHQSSLSVKIQNIPSETNDQLRLF